ncbi:hypothetical protein OPQ81_008348 [Rhizoctonia solani]|nr:hypothetical protein OPQ81_008348 [Rhizoctonia solani]
MHVGDIVYMDMMGQPFVVLNSAQVASDLLEKRSASYSDRVSAPMVTNPTLLDWSGFIGMLPYSDLWRRQRRRMSEWLNIRSVRQFDGLQQDEARLLLRRLLDIPASPQLFEKIKHQFFFTMGSTMFKLAYGYHLKSDQDPFFLNAVEATENLFHSTMMSNFLVNAFPALSYVPDWFPGTGWKRTARQRREQKNRAVDAPYEWAKRQVETGSFEPSVLSALLQDHHLVSGLSEADRDKELKELAFVLFVGGPPHACYRDDVYRGYDIQKGTILLGNVWAMSRDENVYKSPDIFEPERFLDPSVPPVPGFGWGRRKCPGIHFAETSLFLIISSLLTTFTFSRKKDEDGREIVPKIEAAYNDLSLPLKPFDFEVRPRSEKHRQLIFENTVNE